MRSRAFLRLGTPDLIDQFDDQFLDLIARLAITFVGFAYRIFHRPNGHGAAGRGARQRMAADVDDPVESHLREGLVVLGKLFRDVDANIGHQPDGCRVNPGGRGESSAGRDDAVPSVDFRKTFRHLAAHGVADTYKQNPLLHPSFHFRGQPQAI